MTQNKLLVFITIINLLILGFVVAITYDMEDSLGADEGSDGDEDGIDGGHALRTSQAGSREGGQHSPYCAPGRSSLRGTGSGLGSGTCARRLRGPRSSGG
jgi:hypothetical protein